MMYQTLREELVDSLFIPTFSQEEEDNNFSLAVPTLNRNEQGFLVNYETQSHLASYLNVTTEVHQLTQAQKISKIGIPLALLSFAIGLIACHTYIGVSLVAGATVTMSLLILISSVTLNTFVNAYFMQNNFYAIIEEFQKKVFGSSILDLANEDMQNLMPDQEGKIKRTVKFLMWTLGCLGLTAAAVYPFYSVDVNHSDPLPDYFPSWFNTAMEAIPNKSIIVGVAFGGLLYQPVNDMAAQVISNLKHYGRRMLNLETEKAPFVITRTEPISRKKAKQDSLKLAPAIKALKQAHIATIEQSRQYYLGLIQSGRTVIEGKDNFDPILNPLYAALNPQELPSYQASFNLLYKYNTITAEDEIELRTAHPDQTPFWQRLIGILHNPLSWISLLGFVNQAIIAAGSVWLGVLVSSPLLMLSGYMVAQPLIIKIVDYIKNIHHVVRRAWRGENIKLPYETWQQFLARLLPMPLHIIQNPRKLFFILGVATVMGFFSSFVATSLSAQLFASLAVWPLIKFITFYITILFNVNPVDKVCGALFNTVNKCFGSSEQAERSRDEIRLNEFADNQIKMIQDMDDVKFYHIVRDLLDTNIIGANLEHSHQEPEVKDMLSTYQSDALRATALQAFFGYTDLNEFLKLDLTFTITLMDINLGSDDSDYNLQLLQELNARYDEAKDFGQERTNRRISDSDSMSDDDSLTDDDTVSLLINA
jgi:hypothetical protein